MISAYENIYYILQWCMFILKRNQLQEKNAGFKTQPIFHLQLRHLHYELLHLKIPIKVSSLMQLLMAQGFYLLENLHFTYLHYQKKHFLIVLFLLLLPHHLLFNLLSPSLLFNSGPHSVYLRNKSEILEHRIDQILKNQEVLY